MQLRMLLILLALLLATVETEAQNRYPDSTSVSAALRYQHENYPASRLTDVYKNFFQDYFGPGHILTDLSKSKAYLDYELAHTTAFEGPLYEPTGAEGNFYRVNLSVIHDGTVPYGTYFDAFVRSISGIQPPEAQQWIDLWNFIDGIIRKDGYTYDDEKADRRHINEKLSLHDFVIHHSQAYNDHYHFRYRIIARDIFVNEILPLLPDTAFTNMFTPPPSGA